MLAKNYHYPYETIKALATVKRVSKRALKPYVTVEELEYPLWNTEVFVEAVSNLKYRLKGEIEKRHVESIVDNPKVNQIIKRLSKEMLQDVRLRLMVEDGYKEYFYMDPEGEFLFDLTTLDKHNHINKEPFGLHVFKYGHQSIDLAAICPEYWRGKWSMVDVAI